METFKNPEGSGLKVCLRSSRDWNKEVSNEFADATETCFVRLAARYAFGDLTLGDYLDGVLSHLKQNATEHKWDTPPEDISDFLELDLFVGAVKARCLDPAFIPLGQEDFSTLKSLSARSWNTDAPAEFDQLCQEEQIDCRALLPEIADLILVVCYARRHTILFRHLIGLFPGPPSMSTFDLMNEMLLQPRTAYWTAIRQHSPRQQSNSADEISLWTDILNFGWIHDPVNAETQRFLQHGIHSQDPRAERDDSVMFGTQKLRDLHVALAVRGLYCDVATFGGYLASCKSLEEAHDFLTVFPGDQVRPQGRDLYEWESGGLMGAIADSSNLDGKLRTDIMELALACIDGVDVNAPFNPKSWEDDLPGGRRTQCMTALQVAASKGDRDLAEVLLRHGARADVVEYVTGLTAAGFARRSGHSGVAEWLDSLVQK
ncbi:ankyrin repeat domain protein [Colletotrichum incanum]|uniref:Ankyrin repeat domain protein n=1 Tax=Colletotrichum incanum TaxID=1573173 RepID=A0A167B3Q4_COLIC|nr:ankyrin repeat domain protein [Colletotrichum incanum]